MPHTYSDLLYPRGSKLFFTNEEQFLSAWETLGTDAFWERYGKN